MERRQQQDRRKTPTPMVSRYSFFGGRRHTARRKDDRREGYYVDRYGSAAFILFILVVLLGALDGFLAFYVLHAFPGVDHPMVRTLRDIGGEFFILGAFVVGSLCTLFLFLHKNFLIARLAIGAVILFQIATISIQWMLIALFHAQ